MGRRAQQTEEGWRACRLSAHHAETTHECTAPAQARGRAARTLNKCTVCIGPCGGGRAHVRLISILSTTCKTFHQNRTVVGGGTGTGAVAARRVGAGRWGAAVLASSVDTALRGPSLYSVRDFRRGRKGAYFSYSLLVCLEHSQNRTTHCESRPSSSTRAACWPKNRTSARTTRRRELWRRLHSPPSIRSFSCGKLLAVLSVRIANASEPRASDEALNPCGP